MLHHIVMSTQIVVLVTIIVIVRDYSSIMLMVKSQITVEKTNKDHTLTSMLIKMLNSFVMQCLNKLTICHCLIELVLWIANVQVIITVVSQITTIILLMLQFMLTLITCYKMIKVNKHIIGNYFHHHRHEVHLYDLKCHYTLHVHEQPLYKPHLHLVYKINERQV